MEYKGEDFFVDFNESGKLVEFYGTIRLRDKSEYELINDILIKAADTVESDLILDLRNLKYLNSSGINMFSKFIIMARRANKIKVEVLGNSEISWQQKSLRNLQRLWSEVVISIT